MNQKMRKLTTQIIYETFGSIKDLKVLNKENEIINLFTKKINIYEENLLITSNLLSKIELKQKEFSFIA